MIRVGTLKKLNRNCLNNPAGTIGVCYEVYEYRDGERGASFIFPNGAFDGFSYNDLEMFFDPDYESYNRRIANYQFFNVIKLNWDFKHGYFKAVWNKE